MVKLISPLYLQRPRVKAKDYLNLNSYRNWHYRVSNNLKQQYKAVMSKQILCLDYMSEPIQITYVIYPKTRVLFDVANVGTVIDKFFSDALTEHGKIADDNYKFLPRVIFEFGCVDKLNPRCEIIIEKVTTPMKVIVTQQEMESAVTSFFGFPMDTAISLEEVNVVEVPKVTEAEPVKATVVVQTVTKRRRRTKAEIDADAQDKPSVDIVLPEAESGEPVLELVEQGTVETVVEGIAVTETGIPELVQQHLDACAVKDGAAAADVRDKLLAVGITLEASAVQIAETMEEVVVNPDAIIQGYAEPSVIHPIEDEVEPALEDIGYAPESDVLFAEDVEVLKPIGNPLYQEVIDETSDELDSPFADETPVRTPLF